MSVIHIILDEWTEVQLPPRHFPNTMDVDTPEVKQWHE